MWQSRAAADAAHLAPLATPQDGRAPLAAAAQNGMEGCVRALLQAGAKFDEPDAVRKAALRFSLAPRPLLGRVCPCALADSHSEIRPLRSARRSTASRLCSGRAAAASPLWRSCSSTRGPRPRQSRCGNAHPFASGRSAKHSMPSTQLCSSVTTRRAAGRVDIAPPPLHALPRRALRHDVPPADVGVRVAAPRGCRRPGRPRRGVGGASRPPPPGGARARSFSLSDGRWGAPGVQFGMPLLQWAVEAGEAEWVRKLLRVIKAAGDWGAPLADSDIQARARPGASATCRRRAQAPQTPRR